MHRFFSVSANTESTLLFLDLLAHAKTIEKEEAQTFSLFQKIIRIPDPTTELLPFHHPTTGLLPFHQALNNQHINVIQKFIDISTQEDSKGLRTDTLKTLLTSTSNGKNALTIAKETGNGEIIALIEKANENIMWSPLRRKWMATYLLRPGNTIASIEND